ncbi:MAG TPA: LysM peptidoglycan-binding domain-containing protein [Anaerolineaceae bacterium]|nr:LysM peptidoglycan-binding domain-containing protein [Anaerolineaceae bacterium]
MLRCIHAFPLLLLLAFPLTIASLAIPSHAPVSAQTELTAVNIIGAVNALRKSLGKAPYQVDPYLMAYAQEHARYQADTNTLTHKHKDGTMPSQHGILENIAYASIGYLNVEQLISDNWGDATHTKTLLGYPTGTIGVGVASNADYTYVSLDIRPKGVPSVTESHGASPSPTATVQKQNVPSADTSSAAVETSSPTAEINSPTTEVSSPTATLDTTSGTVHTVEEGQTLWSIAVTYGTTIDEIRTWNALDPKTSVIYVGQKLIVGLAPTAIAALPPTATQPPTETLVPPTSTPTEPPPTATSLPTGTSIPIPATAGITSQPPPFMPILAGALILLGAAGLLFARARLGSV